MNSRMNTVVGYLVFFVFQTVLATSYNQPKFSPTAKWDANGTTFVNITTIGSDALNIFLDDNNTIYVAASAMNTIQIWLRGNANSMKNISTGLTTPPSVFVTRNGSIFIGNSYPNRQIEIRSLDGLNQTIVMNRNGSCRSLYIDNNNTLYCSLDNLHQILKVQLDGNLTSIEVAAGIGQNGSMGWMLDQPKGIFVASNFSLYVADHGNDRIQMFQQGSLNGTTVAGDAASGTISLRSPMDVALDGNGYLFIADYSNNRIVGSGPNGFRCIIGCISSTILQKPKAFSFDTLGNIYATDQIADRVQKFILTDNSFGISYNRPKLCPYARWSANITVIANEITVGTDPWGVFVDKNNTLYVMARSRDQIVIWREGATNPTRTVDIGSDRQTNLFVTVNGEIYFDQKKSGIFSVQKWSRNGTPTTTVMNLDGRCYGLFVDIYENIYCSRNETHQIVKQSSNDNTAQSTVIAGNGTKGSSNQTLSYPHGIFVTVEFDLYVADCGNDRVQLFKKDSREGITVVGRGINTTANLDCPVSVILDQDGFLFIVDYHNHRIVVSDSTGFRCIPQCNSSANSLSGPLRIHPQTISFDRYGNIYATDGSNNRILKIHYGTQNCASYKQPFICSSSAWASDGITMFNETMVGITSFSFFMDKRDIIYIIERTSNQIYIQNQTNRTLIKNISNSLNQESWAIFVTVTNDIFFEITDANSSRIEKLSANSSTAVPVFHPSHRCFDIFVDIYDNLYCSMNDAHQVIRQSTDDYGNKITTVIAGNGTQGSTNSLLAYPRGIFVTQGLYLFVADCGNDRVLLFGRGSRSAYVRAGIGANGTIDLNCPTSVTLDYNGYLYITDSNNHRIIRSSSAGFRCIIGCRRMNGSSSDQLSYPRSLFFDKNLNIYVVDSDNHRIQKFLFNSKSCDTSYNLPQFSNCVSWKDEPVQISTNITTGSSPLGLFVSKNNSLYVNAQNEGCILIWHRNSTAPSQKIDIGATNQTSVFVALNGDVYFDNQTNDFHYVYRWINDLNVSFPVMVMDARCSGLFLDLNENIYCSMNERHQVMKRSYHDQINITSVVAGNGTSGSTTDTLSEPRGIFIDKNFNLYVADCGNNRIQLFHYGDMNATTVVGNNVNINLTCPISVIIDANQNLFIADDTHRIFRSGPAGHQCIIGCNSITGSSFISLHRPTSISFDSTGNIFIAHDSNHTIVKFLVMNQTCDYSTVITLIRSPTTIYPITSERKSSLTTEDDHITTTQKPPVSFACPQPFFIGPFCNISTAPCHMLQPCQNNATCTNTNSSLAYHCSCPPRFNGIHCEIDQRPCQLHTCRNNGTCNETSSTTFHCHCPIDWTGERCETKINHCSNVTCQNSGVCRPLVGNYRCECVDSEYSGRHCEIQPMKLVTRQTVSKSFGYVAIVALSLVLLFIVSMDVLKYVFGIDPVDTERKRRQERRKTRARHAVDRRRPRVIQHFVYIN